MPRVVVAMSGGVDSSVAAALLKQAGLEVIGVTMQIWPADSGDDQTGRFGGCCGLDAVADAQRVASALGISHYVMNLRQVFTDKVIADFCGEYSRGRTPNPCIRCNQHIKFGVLLDRARALGADFVATGHYARIERINGAWALKKGLDPRKDQSYALHTMTQEQLAHTLMPLGGMTKPEVRQVARQLGLQVADKPESQDICFVADGDYPRFVAERVPRAAEPGPIMDREGNILGKHRGLPSYTVGQRRGLGLAVGEPLYVTAIDSGRNAVVVGSRQEAHGDYLTAKDVNWIGLTKPEHPIQADVKIRYLHREARARVVPLGADMARVAFGQPQLAITPGQAVVFYDHDLVVGGGTII